MTTENTSPIRLKYLDQKWKFQFPNKGEPSNKNRNDSIMKLIEEVESKSLEDRILDVHERDIISYLKRNSNTRRSTDMSATKRNSLRPSSVVAYALNNMNSSFSSDNDGTLTNVTNEKELISIYDANELAISMNTIRMFYAQKNHDMNQTFKENMVVDKVQDSPHKKDLNIPRKPNMLSYDNGNITVKIEEKVDKVQQFPALAQAIATSNMRASFTPNIYIPADRNSSFLVTPTNRSNSTPLHHRSNSQVGQDLFASASPSRRRTANRKAKTKMSYNFNDGDFNKVDVEMAGHSQAIATKMMRSRAGILRNKAEQTRLKLATTQEQVINIEISKHFKKYANDHGYRTPVCLQNMAPLPGPGASITGSGTGTAVSSRPVTGGTGAPRRASVSTSTSHTISRVNSLSIDDHSVHSTTTHNNTHNNTPGGYHSPHIQQAPHSHGAVHHVMKTHAQSIAPFSPQKPGEDKDTTSHRFSTSTSAPPSLSLPSHNHNHNHNKVKPFSPQGEKPALIRNTPRITLVQTYV